MKVKYVNLLSLVLLLVMLVACEDKDEGKKGRDTSKMTDSEYVNYWVLDSMSIYYLWNNKLPAESALNFKLSPYDFLDQLTGYEKSLYGEVFSRLEGTHLNIPKSSTTSSDLGFEFIRIQFVDSYNRPLFYRYLVVYVKRGTKAESFLKRGYLISHVDDVAITQGNWSSLLYQNKGEYKLRFEKNRDDMNRNITQERTLSVTTGYKNTPIFMDTVYTEGSHKIGYIVYNSFEAGGEATLPYDVDLANILTDFKENKKITDLILDFRYNGGGLVRSARFLASALVPQRSLENIFEVKTYNPDIQSYLNKLPDNNVYKKSMMYEYFTDKVSNGGGSLAKIPELGDQLNNLYVIGTQNTASASEMVINTLRPYMQDAGKNVFLIGETTRGKNVGSWAIYEENNSKNTYVLWPITFQSHNKLYPRAESSAYASGFTPDVEADDFEMLGEGLKNLGDKEETMLKTTISKIVNPSLVKTKKTETKKNYIIKGSSLDRKSGAGHMYIDKRDVKIIDIKLIKEK